MESKTLNISVVVLAQEHNPSILHPSFLSSQGIVPKDWETDDPPLCMPPISIVKYKNGIVFTVEKNKFQVLQSPPPSQLRDSEIPKLAKNYIGKLPHVKYTDVGINVTVALFCKEPEKFLIEKFLTLENCNVDGLELQAVSLRFVYPINNGVLNLSCEPAKVETEELSEKSSAIMVQANYHNKLSGDAALQEANDAISAFADRFDHFENTVMSKIFGNGGKNSDNLGS